MLIGRDYDAVLGTGIDIDMRIDAALADQLQFGQAFDQGAADCGPLAEEDEGFGFAQPLCKGGRVMQMVGVDRNIMAVQLGKAGEAAQRIVPIVQNSNAHCSTPPIYDSITPTILSASLACAKRHDLPFSTLRAC